MCGTRSLPEAWGNALYGPHGFYRQQAGPAAHFSTSAQGLPGVGELLADCVAALCDRYGLTSVVDFACGRGELLHHLAKARPDLHLLGVDVVPRPSDLDARVEWMESAGAALVPKQLTGLQSTLVIAHEWLDVVPCEIAVPLEDSPTELCILGVNADGLLVPTRRLDAVEAQWQQRNWPRVEHLVEIGTTRDVAYRDLLGRISTGLLVCVDYGHRRDDRPADGTFVGYRGGTVCAPAFDGSTDLTAHVAMDTLGADELVQQKDIAARLLPVPQRPDHALATTAPAEYVAQLARRSAWSAFTDPAGLGSFWWSLQPVAISAVAATR